MSARVLVIEDEEAIGQLLAYNLQKEGFTVAIAADGDEALIAIDEEQARHRAARLDAARTSRASSSAARSAPARDPRHPGHHADRPRRGGGPGPRPRRRRRRLRDQALLDVRARRADARGPPPHRAALAGDVAVFADLVLDRQHCRVQPRQARHPPRADRVPPARRADAAPGPGLFAASSSSTGSGARTSTSRSAPSTSTSAGCARRSTAAANATRSARCGRRLRDRRDLRRVGRYGHPPSMN